ncbi:hypothetical protein DB88DRAFT_525561 [Papiliotrema laurentii]|uniref:Uncharacterized protein n=1 Tax=Papiliotrema laurentii TaxID=5418 RepID=A0AAD9FRQ6_PAPLA|nr:hypothetical protein DB88DRAFT_525561 [Papiliotrema laurentii]
MSSSDNTTTPMLVDSDPNHDEETIECLKENFFWRVLKNARDAFHTIRGKAASNVSIMIPDECRTGGSLNYAKLLDSFRESGQVPGPNGGDSFQREILPLGGTIVKNSVSKMLSELNSLSTPAKPDPFADELQRFPKTCKLLSNFVSDLRHLHQLASQYSKAKDNTNNSIPFYSKGFSEDGDWDSLYHSLHHRLDGVVNSGKPEELTALELEVLHSGLNSVAQMEDPQGGHFLDSIRSESSRRPIKPLCLLQSQLLELATAISHVQNARPVVAPSVTQSDDAITFGMKRPRPD